VIKAPRGRWYCFHCAQILKCSPSKKAKKSLLLHLDNWDEAGNEDGADGTDGADGADGAGCRPTRHGPDAAAETPADESSQRSSLEDTQRERENQEAVKLERCVQLLEELRRHDDGWPFLEPVNVKVFPQYKKVIKKAMDFRLIEKKVAESR
jgi:hypothetical protein